MPNRVAIVLASLLLAIGSGISAQSQADAILASASLFGAAPNILAKAELTITDGADIKTRGLELYVARSAKGSKSLAVLTSPSFLSGMKFLKILERGEPDAQWLKTSRGLRRLGEGDRSERVFGSHFTVEDFAVIDSSSFDLTIDEARSDPVKVLIRAVPLRRSAYAFRAIAIERDSGLVTEMTDSDASGAVLRRYRVLETNGTGAGKRPVSVRIEERDGSGTTLSVIHYETPAELSPRFFNPASL